MSVGAIGTTSRTSPAPRARRRSLDRHLASALLIAPLLLFTLALFAAPLVNVLRQAVWNTDIAAAWPHLTTELGRWDDSDGSGVPPEPVFAALAQDLGATFGSPAFAQVARRLSYDIDDARALLGKTEQRLDDPSLSATGWKTKLIAIDSRWGSPEIWAALRGGRSRLTDYFLLRSLDLQRNLSREIVARPADQAIYVGVLQRTFAISLSVTILCLALGFPVAHWLAAQPASRANLMLILVLLPFWTPLLVRTAAWVVILQENGLVNEALEYVHAIGSPLQLLYNRFAVLVAMVHVLLPFMILPLYSVMKSVPSRLIQASLSLGATPRQTFFRVYLPLVAPGITAGALLVFVLALGYYITPALVGGPSDQMVSYFVAFNITQTINWSLAAALGSLLLAATFILLFVMSLVRRRTSLAGLE